MYSLKLPSRRLNVTAVTLSLCKLTTGLRGTVKRGTSARSRAAAGARGCFNDIFEVRTRHVFIVIEPKHPFCPCCTCYHHTQTCPGISGSGLWSESLSNNMSVHADAITGYIN